MSDRELNKVLTETSAKTKQFMAHKKAAAFMKRTIRYLKRKANKDANKDANNARNRLPILLEKTVTISPKGRIAKADAIAGSHEGWGENHNKRIIICRTIWKKACPVQPSGITGNKRRNQCTRAQLRAFYS